MIKYLFISLIVGLYIPSLNGQDNLIQQNRMSHFNLSKMTNQNKAIKEIVDKDVLIQNNIHNIEKVVSNYSNTEMLNHIIIDDFLVNDDTSDGAIGQSLPKIASDGKGNFVVVWEDERNGNIDIYFQRYNSNGIPQGINTKVNDDGIQFQGSPSVGMDSAGNFVIVWQDRRNLNNDIYFQRYNSIGVPIGPNILVNDDNNNKEQLRPAVAMNPSGKFIIVWEDYRSFGNIYFQIYNSDGTPQGSNTIATDNTSNIKIYNPAVAIDKDGNFVIVWEDNRINVNFDIFMRRFNSNGVAQGTAVRVNQLFGGSNNCSNPEIAYDNFGNFIVTWTRSGLVIFQRYDMNGNTIGVNNTLNYGITPSISINLSGKFVITWHYINIAGIHSIFFQRFNQDGSFQGLFTIVNDNNYGERALPKVVWTTPDNFIIVWQDSRRNQKDIYLQMFDSLGIQQGINKKVNDDFGGNVQVNSKVAMDSSGNFVIVWQDNRNGNNDIYFQRYNSNGIPQGTNMKVNDDDSNANQLLPCIAMSSNGNFVIAWQDNRNGNFDIFYQRYNSNGISQGVNTIVNDDVGNRDQSSPAIAMDAAGNFVIVWQDARAGYIFNDDIYFQRYTFNGIPIGSNIKVNDDTNNKEQEKPSIAMNASGNFVIAWRDNRNPSGLGFFDFDIFYQRYNSEGIAQGVNSNAIILGGVPNHQDDPVVAIDLQGNFVIAWEDFRNPSGIYFQRFNHQGIPQEYNRLAGDINATGFMSNPDITMDTNGNFIIIWEDYRTSKSNPNIIGQKFLNNGIPIGNNYLIVADGPHKGELQPAITSKDDLIILTWTDNRRSKYWDIYAKSFSWNWNGINNINNDKITLLDKFILYQNYPNPFNSSTTISWQSPISGRVTIKLYDILGREIETIIDGYYEAGKHSTFYIPNSTLPSGVYFYMLQIGNFIKVNKMILTK